MILEKRYWAPIYIWVAHLAHDAHAMSRVSRVSKTPHEPRRALVNARTKHLMSHIPL